MKLLELLLGVPKQEEDASDDEDPGESSRLNSYIDNLDIQSAYVKLQGPYLCEQYALKYLDIYKDLLRQTYYRVNLCINRQLALISYDTTLETMDNVRVKLDIPPFNHRFELFCDKKDFVVIGVDGNILLNRDDATNIKQVLQSFPITMQELKYVHL